MEPLRQQAKEVMARLSEEFADEPPLRLRVKGLRYMNDDPSAVDVLYACVGEVGSRRAARESDKAHSCHDRSALLLGAWALTCRFVWRIRRSGRLEKIGAAVVKAFSEEGLLLEKAPSPTIWRPPEMPVSYLALSCSDAVCVSKAHANARCTLVSGR